MSWIPIMIFSLLIFVLFVFLFTRFVGYMKKEQNLHIESLQETLIDRDNPIGLSGDELQKLKNRQKEAQDHLKEVIAKLPVVKKDGRFQIDDEQLKKRREEQAADGSVRDDGA
ncbi:hypothetical protein EKD00_04635 [Chlorobium phaeovibrioides]|uniref:Uncharacterized protein n=2 Tax=Chlorobium phaeovibrioides TaxID=1094 RepID=A0A432AW85_CHLPH|nr:hypothetical protein [Chlorobium phaeovibrioides]HCD35963.1 hypothetical protein [Chlorobium sp.]KAA6230647.1 hypothetical protein FP507_10390 [Chlorobium phaeovibrioides]MDT9546407.1 hypothetical protein [Chlorobium phaeovibrioides]MWV54367.1 hypothetical protein [Chlorobium phaeovibrioides]QEQ56485.1 hypothetical protein FNV82_01615 [Chlorobium phaeovibrioides]